MATEDENEQIKRRARWRLIGAMGLALVVFVVLPLVFDPKPKPLGNGAEVLIAQPLPVTTPLVAATPDAEEGAGDVPTLPAPTVAPPPPKPAPVSKPISGAAEKPAEMPTEKPVAEAAGSGKTLGDTGFYLQLGVFGKEENARQLAAKVKAMGYKVSISPVGDRYRVRAVGFKSRDSALDAKKALKKKGIAADVYGS